MCFEFEVMEVSFWCILSVFLAEWKVMSFCFWVWRVFRNCGSLSIHDFRSLNNRLFKLISCSSSVGVRMQEVWQVVRRITEVAQMVPTPVVLVWDESVRLWRIGRCTVGGLLEELLLYREIRMALVGYSRL
jgi:hypothetical protein